MKFLKNYLKVMLTASLICCFQFGSFLQNDVPCGIPVDMEMGTPSLITSDPDKCVYEFNFININSSIEDDYCVEWSYGGNVLSGTLTQELEFPCTGETYTVCAVVSCCDYPNAEPVEYCTELVADCCETECLLPPQSEFMLDVVYDECSVTFDTHLSSADGICFRWQDSDGNVLSSDPYASTLTFTEECPYEGEFDVCVVAFCCNDEGIDINACAYAYLECNCECEPYEPSPLAVSVLDDCIYEFSIEVDPSLHCVSWTFNSDPIGFGNSLTIDGKCHESGLLELRVFCCETGEVLHTESSFIEFECSCCEPLQSIDVHTALVTENCGYLFEALIAIPAGANPSDYCYNWTLDGIVIPGNSASISYQMDCNDIAEHDLCVEIRCCENNEVIGIQCTHFTAACDCNPECVCPDITNILEDGDFEEPVHTFTSGIGITPGCTDGVLVVNEPRDKCTNSLWCDDFWDHTFGTPNGHFLMVDGDIGNIWAEQVSVTSGQTYFFTFWQVRELSDFTSNNSTQILQLEVDNDIVATINTSAAPEKEWVQYCAEWVSDEDGLVTLEINQLAETGFNDFGIDDIEFGTCSPCPQIDPNLTIQSVDGTMCEYTISVADDPTIDPDVHCITWTLNGDPYPAADGLFEFDFGGDCDLNGNYEVCATITCCESEDVLFSECRGFTVDCPCPCDPIDPIIFAESDSGLMCYYHISVITNVSLNPDKYCIKWTLNGNPYPAADGLFSFAFGGECELNGNYEACATIICCETDEELYHDCVEFTVDCPCPCDPIDPNLIIEPINNSECEYHISVSNSPALNPDVHCITWTLNGNPYAAADGQFDFNFGGACELNGNYEVCATITCCETDDILYHDCRGFTVDCPCCEPQDFFVLHSVPGCDFSVGITSVNPDLHCVYWSLDGGAFTLGDSSFNYLGDCTQNGDHEICYEVRCCLDGSVLGEGCIDFTIDCRCDHPFFYQANADGCVGCLDLIWESQCPSEIVYYTYGDGTSGTDSCHEYSQAGTYTMCAISCCPSNIDADGNIIDITLCEELCDDVVIDELCCSTELPNEDELSIEVIQSDGCSYSFFANYPHNSAQEQCIQWSADGGTTWTDGGLNFSYDFTCWDNGVQTVCVRVLCCGTPEVYVKACIEVDVSCPCILPSGILVGVELSDDCSLIYVSTGTTDDYCGELCHSISINGTVVGDNTMSSFPVSGSQSYEVCYTVWCCNNDLVEPITECVTVEADCCTQDDLNPGITVIQDECTYTYIPTNNGIPLDPDTDCYEFNISGGVLNPDGSYTMDFSDNCETTFGACLRVICCGTDLSLEICETYLINCCPDCDNPQIDDYFTAIDQDDDCPTWFFQNDVDDFYNTFDYIWCVDGMVSGTGNDLLYTFPGDGVYQVCLKVFCEETGEFISQYCEPIEVNCDPCPHECEVYAVWQSVSNGLTVTFTDLTYTGPTTTITSWFWTFGDGGTSTLQNPVHTYNSAGSFSVNLYVTAVDDQGVECDGHFCWIVQTECEEDSIEPCVVDADFNSSIISNEGCVISFLDNSSFTSGTTPVSWTWTFGDGGTSSLQNPIHNYTSSGVYVVTLTVVGVNDGVTCSSFIAQEVEVFCEIQPCEGDVAFEYETDGCKVKFYDVSSVSHPIINYAWNFGDGTIVSNGGSSMYHEYSSTGAYQVTLTLTLDLGGGLPPCYLSITQTVWVFCSIIDNDDPDALGTLDEFDLKAFPNPTSGQLILELDGFENDEILLIEIKDATGKSVYTLSEIYSGAPLELWLNNYEAGLYTVIVSNNSTILTSRVVKE